MNAPDQWIRGDWIQTYTGRKYFPIAPSAEDVDIVDISHSLSMQCRYAGHCKMFYSVAEHSVLVSYLVPPEHALTALMHDATEAYLVDVPRPVKRQLPNYKEIEQLNWLAVAARFDLPTEIPQCVHDADTNILYAERNALMTVPPAPWANEDVVPPDVEIQGWLPAEACRRFTQRYQQLREVN